MLTCCSWRSSPLCACPAVSGTSPRNSWSVVFSVTRSYTEPGSESSEQETIRAADPGTVTLHYTRRWSGRSDIDSCMVSAVLDSSARTRLAILCTRAVASRPRASYDGFEASDLANLASFLVSSGGIACTTSVSGIGARPPALDTLGTVLDSLSSAVLTGCPR